MYNKKRVMQNAWIEKKNTGISMSVALKGAWALERLIVKAEEEQEDVRKCDHSKIYVNDWRKYGKSRTYVSLRVYTAAWNAKYDIKFGYIDNLTGEYHAA